jgi:hypothetical protein
LAMKWHDLVVGNYYDPHVQIALASEWLSQVATATCQARRTLCLRQAEHCLDLVHRSIFTPVLLEATGATLASLPRPANRISVSAASATPEAGDSGTLQNALARTSEER